ncbi:uncharacterized protein LOC115034746 [Acyrthosiphon pisum]|uniref:Uncharacterized protein n=1 Tax=Acyrthosiphon pisum TaxID=7029 RepID=A0A8R2JWT8_ACYPI|nr:uncharacterized protein LOC115034746 [Acyrthosiphon pisum]
MIKSDISCTEDEHFNGILKHVLKRSLSPKSKPSIKVKINSENQGANSSSYPPQYNPMKDTIGPDISDSQYNINQISNDPDSESSNISDFDDSDEDQTWTVQKKKNIRNRN